MARGLYLISYDVPDDRQRLKIMHLLEGHGERVQYSVFEVWASDEALDKLRKQLKPHVAEAGSVRIYPLCGKCEQVREVLGEGAPTEVEELQIV